MIDLPRTMDFVVGDSDGDDAVEVEDENDDFAGTQSLRRWTKGVTDPGADYRVNIWSLNGFGQPVFTGGMYLPDEARTLQETLKNYCASKNVTLSELCGGQDHAVHDKRMRGAWQEIAQCLPHRTVLSVYRRALRQCHGMTRGTWSKEEIASLFRLVELHGHRWKIVQDKLGRSATDCRVKFFDLNDKFQRGKWSVENVDLLLKKVRAALNVSRGTMDVREINQWTLEQNSKIPWTSISCRVNRRRSDCYFKWKQMTKRSNKKAIELGLEPVPMARESLKFDVRSEYYQWKAEQDPKFEFVLPLFQKEGDGVNAQKEHDIKLIDSIIESKATRPSEVSWHTLVQRGEAPRDRWEGLVDKYAHDDDMDLPLWKLAKVVKEFVSKDASYDTPDAVNEKSSSETERDNQSEADDGNYGDERKKKRKEKKQTSASSSSNHVVDLDIAGVPIEQVQKAIRKIVDKANHDDLTTKKVRKILEEQLQINLSSHKELIKKMVKEVL